MPATSAFFAALLDAAMSDDHDLLDEVADMAQTSRVRPAPGLGNPLSDVTHVARQRVAERMQRHLDGGNSTLEESEDAEVDSALMEAGKSGVFKDARQHAYCLRDGKRVACATLSKDELAKGDVKDWKPAAGKGSKKPPVAKPAKMTPEEAKGRIAGMLKVGKASEQDVSDLAAHLLSLTVPQLNALKKDLGLKASGAKAELAKKIASRALEAAAKNPVEPVLAKPVSAKPAVAPSNDSGSVASAFQKLDRNGHNQVSLADLADETGMDTKTMHDVVNDLRRKGILSGQGAEGHHGLSAREKAAMIPPIDQFDQGVLYVSVRPGKEAEFARLAGGSRHDGR